MSTAHWISAAVLAIVAAGLWFRKRKPALHRALMASALVTDVSLLIFIEATRHAVHKTATQGSLWLMLHAGVSLGVLGCYGALVALGVMLHRGRESWRRLHFAFGIAFLFLRSLNFVTSFGLG